MKNQKIKNKRTRAITKGHEYHPQPFTKKLLIVTEYRPAVTCINFVKGQKLNENSIYPPQQKYLFLSYIYFIICKCFQFGLTQNFVVC